MLVYSHADPPVMLCWFSPANNRSIILNHRRKYGIVNFSQFVVMILGAIGNLGQACVEVFHRHGAHLVLVDRSSEGLDVAFSMFDSATHTLVGGIDLSDQDAVNRLVINVEEKLGCIDVLVNTVGAFRGGQSVQDEPLETWDYLLNVNLFTAVVTSRAVVPLMLKKQAGRIINVISRNALKGAANYAAYSAAKSALLRLSEALAAELKANGITVNCVIPGTIDTPQNREAMPDSDVTKWVTPLAIADVIAFLASDAARAVTGAAVPVDGEG